MKEIAFLLMINRMTHPSRNTKRHWHEIWEKSCIAVWFPCSTIVTYFHLFIYFPNVWHFSLKCYWEWQSENGRRKNNMKIGQPDHWFPGYKTQVVLFNNALWIVPILIEFSLTARNFCEFILWINLSWPFGPLDSTHKISVMSPNEWFDAQKWKYFSKGHDGW